MKISDIIEVIVKIILIVLFIIIIIWSIQIFLGGSPTLSQLNSMFIGLVITVLFTLTITFMKTFSSINREIGEIKVGMKHSFNNAKNDMDLIKNDINLIKEKLGV